MQLRHMMETEAVNAAERAAGKPLPGARQVTVAFADLVGFTRLGEAVSPEELGHLASRLANLARDMTVPPVRFIKTIGDAVMFVCPDPRAIARCRAEARRGRRHRQRLPAAAGGGGLRHGGEPGRRLVRQPGQRGEPGHRRGAPGHRAGRRFGLGGGRRHRRSSTGLSPVRVASRASRARSSFSGFAGRRLRDTTDPRRRLTLRESGIRIGRPGRLWGAFDSFGPTRPASTPASGALTLVASGPASLPKIRRRTAHINGFPHLDAHLVRQSAFGARDAPGWRRLAFAAGERNSITAVTV